MKKLVSLLLALTMLVSMISLAEYNGASPVFDEPVTISILTNNGANVDAPVMEAEWFLHEFKKNNFDLKVEQISSSAYGDVVQPRLAAGKNLQDIVLISGNESKLAESGNFIALDELIEEYGINLKTWFDKYPTLEGTLRAPDGHIYFLPYLYTTSGTCRTMILNTQYLDSLGMTIDDIKTLDDFYEYLVAVKENDMNGDGDPNNEIPLFVRAGYLLPMAMYFCEDVDNVGGYPIDDNGKVYCSYISDNFRSFLEWCKKLYDEGLINPSFLTANYDEQAAAFAENNIGCIFHFVSNASGYSTAIDPNFNGFEDAPLMQVTAIEDIEGNPVTYGRGIIGKKFGISKDCKNPEDVFKFIDYCYSEEFGRATWYGIENVDYTVENGVTVFNEKYYDSAYRGEMGYNNDALPGYQYDMSSVQFASVYNRILSLNDYIMNPSRYDKALSEEQAEIIGTYRTDLGTYFSENYVAFILGTKSFDEWDAYVTGAYEMGLQNVLDVFQELEG